MSSDCFVWRGSRTTGGYARKFIRGKSVYLHRMAFAWAHGREPVGLVRHTCDNPSCVNPDHLIEGSQKDNIQDAVTRGRIAYGKRHGMAKLTDQAVLEIFRLRRSGLTTYAIAKRFKVGHQCVSKVLAGQRWSHVGERLSAAPAKTEP